ncbi:MAG: TrkH family potassium uptake protein [Eubacterium sp.]
MNGSIIRRILGYVLVLEAGLMLLPCAVALYYGENQGFAYLQVSVAIGFIGVALALKKPKNNVFYLKEGCVATALSWIVLSLCGCLPFIVTGEIPSFTDALFETISGFTTTGASILSDVEALSRCSLFWRSFTHWIGGMGVLVFILAVVPLSGGSNINILKAESPGPSVGKIVPQMRKTARILYYIYIGMTALEIAFLVAGKMPFFDAVTTSFGTAGTGGFGIKNSSIGGYSDYIQWVVTIFMIMFGVNFNAYYLLLFRQFRKAFSMEEVRWFLVTIAVSVGIVFVNIYHLYNSVEQALSKAAFQVASIITTTGFSTADFDKWPINAKMVLVLLMFVGACAGSTGGGIKVSRFIVAFKTVIKEFKSYIHPKSVNKIKLDGKPVEHEVIRSTNVYLITFIVVFVGSMFLISFEDKDLATSFTAVAATINNIGPGLELVGPTQNFGFFSGLSKYVLMFDMLAGRLELFPLLIMVNPSMWIEVVKQGNTKRRKRHNGH